MLQRIFLFGLLMLWGVGSAGAQVIHSDSVLLATMEHNAVRRYNALLGTNQHIFRGPQYVEFLGQEDKNPFFGSSDWMDCNVRYDGQGYQVPVLYNIVKDELAVLLPNGNATQIEKARISGFDLHGGHFVNMEDNQLKEKGFYQVLFDGKVQVLARRKKQFIEKVTYDGAYYQYLNRDFYLLHKNGTYYTVKGKGSVLKVLADHKKELRKFLSENRISFGSSKETALVKMADYYNSLMK